jgi:hypothetical protein
MHGIRLGGLLAYLYHRDAVSVAITQIHTMLPPSNRDGMAMGVDALHLQLCRPIRVVYKTILEQ